MNSKRLAKDLLSKAPQIEANFAHQTPMNTTLSVEDLGKNVREMLANLTARSANGMVSLPSVTFTVFQQQPAKKTLSRSKKPKASKM